MLTPLGRSNVQNPCPPPLRRVINSSHPLGGASKIFPPFATCPTFFVSTHCHTPKILRNPSGRVQNDTIIKKDTFTKKVICGGLYRFLYGVTNHLGFLKLPLNAQIQNYLIVISGGLYRWGLYRFPYGAASHLINSEASLNFHIQNLI